MDTSEVWDEDEWQKKLRRPKRGGLYEQPSDYVGGSSADDEDDLDD